MTDRAVLVTGGSRGIGLAIVRAFADLGDRVAVHHRDSAARAAEIVAGLPGRGHAAVQADLADPEAVRRAVDQAAGCAGACWAGPVGGSGHVCGSVGGSGHDCGWVGGSGQAGRGGAGSGEGSGWPGGCGPSLIMAPSPTQGW